MSENPRSSAASEILKVATTSIPQSKTQRHFYFLLFLFHSDDSCEHFKHLELEDVLHCAAAHDWLIIIWSYLTDRYQCVDLDGHISMHTKVMFLQ